MRSSAEAPGAGPLAFVAGCVVVGGALAAVGLRWIPPPRGWVGEGDPRWSLGAGIVLLLVGAFQAWSVSGSGRGRGAIPGLGAGPTVRVVSDGDRGEVFVLLGAPVFAFSLVTLGADLASDTAMDNFPWRVPLLAGPAALYGLYLAHLGGRYGPTALVLSRERFALGERLEASLRRDPGFERVERVSVRLACIEVRTASATRRGTTDRSSRRVDIWEASVDAAFQEGREARLAIPLPPELPPTERAGARGWTLEVLGKGGATRYGATFEMLPIAAEGRNDA